MRYFARENAVKLEEIFDQSDSIIEPWPDFEANCFHVGGPYCSAFKLVYRHLRTYGGTIPTHDYPGIQRVRNIPLSAAFGYPLVLAEVLKILEDTTCDIVI